MSEQIETLAWVWQGFYGPRDAAEAARALVDIATPAAEIGARVPLEDGGLVSVDVHDNEWMFAVMTRPANPWPRPDGMKVARPEIVGRLVGA
jgi:hypothetical protein